MSEIKTIEEVREYVQREYWQEGKSKGVSGYEKFKVDYWWNGRLCQALNEAFNLRGKKFIDLGCAYGQVVAIARLFGADAHGIDLSDFAIKEGHKEVSWLRGYTHQGSIHNLKRWKDNSFDLIYSNQVFEHVPGQLCDLLAAETFRVAKPGCILWAGLVLDIAGELIDKDGRNPEDPDKSHINIRPKDWWDEKFLRAGWQLGYEWDNKFRQVRVEPDNYSFFDDYGWHTICYRKD